MFHTGMREMKAGHGLLLELQYFLSRKKATEERRIFPFCPCTNRPHATTRTHKN
jgi:hypothetical protein